MRVANTFVWLTLRLRMFNGGRKPSRVVADGACDAVNAVLSNLFACIRSTHAQFLYTHTVITSEAGYYARELAHPAIGVLPLCVAIAMVGNTGGGRIAPGLKEPVRMLLRTLPLSAGPELTRDVRGWVRGQTYKPVVALLLLHKHDVQVAQWLAGAAPHIAADPEALARLHVQDTPTALQNILRATAAVTAAPHMLTHWGMHPTSSSTTTFPGKRVVTMTRVDAKRIADAGDALLAYSRTVVATTVAGAASGRTEPGEA